ncbi:hypothetical protein RJ639_036175 [Escallonia herrerae]|uniref:Uncharacterized protein n=1 Tax=Escallonia herrerae TaxID=1293975 RepID=A0AA88WR82_9ASTE|nr:hypothetical protein RJ639_036175 [Escallonia herrerae]
MSKLRGIPQHQLNKTVQSGRPQDMYSSYMAKKPPASLDEFKYGFPSDGLSTASNKWWGSSIDGNGNGRHGGENIQQDTRHSNELVDEGLDMLCSGVGKSGSGTDESNIGHQGTGLLAAVREKAVVEGRKALKLGVYRCYGERRLSRRRERCCLGYSSHHCQVSGDKGSENWTPLDKGPESFITALVLDLALRS